MTINNDGRAIPRLCLVGGLQGRANAHRDDSAGAGFADPAFLTGITAGLVVDTDADSGLDVAAVSRLSAGVFPVWLHLGLYPGAMGGVCSSSSSLIVVFSARRRELARSRHTVFNIIGVFGDGRP